MNFLYILLALFVFGILVFIHELGHFLVARWCDVEILEFAIGMGPKIFSKKSQKSGTVYSLRLLPIGGFVSMLGENGMEVVQGNSDDDDSAEVFFINGDEEDTQKPAPVPARDEEQAKRAYCNQSVWKRILISLAGPFMNVLLGFLLMLVILVAVGPDNIGTTTVADFHIVYQSEESLSGIVRGDYIDAIDGIEVNSFAQMKDIVANDADGLFDVTIRRLTEDKTDIITHTFTNVAIDDAALTSRFVSSVSEQFGLQTNDEIIKVNNVRVHTHYELSYEITMQGYRAVDLTVIREGQRIVLEDVVFPNMVDDETNITTGTIDFRVYAEQEYNLLTILKHTWYRSLSMVKMVYDSLEGLFTGRYGIEAVSGPVGITKQITTIAKTGFLNLLSMMAIISINLGVMNLLPFPALDGGHLLLYAVEIIRRKPVKKEVEGIINFVGLVILLTFAVIIAIKDIIAL